MYPLTIGLVIETKELWDEVHSTLQELPVRLLIEQHELGSLSEFLDKIERLRPEVMILEVMKLREPMEHVVGRIKAGTADPMVIALHNTAEPELILAALRAGAHEFLHPPVSASLQQALERKSHERYKARERLRQKGRVIGFLSAKGGCGATTIACHTASELGRQGKHVLLADLDLDAGMVRFLMKTKSPYSVLDALNNLHRLDQSYWNALISNGMPGLEIISAPQALASKQSPNEEQLQNLLSFCRGQYDFSIVDLGRSLNLTAMNSLEEIDETYLVTTLDVPALHQSKQIIQTLSNVGYGRERLRLVLNRMPQRLDVTPDELEKMMSLPVFATLPNDYPSLYESYSEGTLLPPNSKLGKELSRMAIKVAGIQDEKGGKKKFSLFS
ncbi:MAG TPA: AAA family ATPase [Bryobacterales bacterium]|nr:AAA family ATPase [Bryobacterales bacterium]